MTDELHRLRLQDAIDTEPSAEADAVLPPAGRDALWAMFSTGEKLAYGCGYRDGKARPPTPDCTCETVTGRHTKWCDISEARAAAPSDPDPNDDGVHPTHLGPLPDPIYPAAAPSDGLREALRAIEFVHGICPRCSGEEPEHQYECSTEAALATTEQREGLDAAKRYSLRYDPRSGIDQMFPDPDGDWVFAPRAALREAGA